MKSLYSAIEPYNTGYLDTSDGHSLYYEQCGNPSGKPVIFLHGGPGLGCLADNRRFFDPERYRIILMDQRGAGRSKPFASLHNNTTTHLIEDIEGLRTHLAVEKWQVFGGSWGSTLALAYAQAYPQFVTELLVRGIFLSRKEELGWLYQDGLSHVYADEWEHFIDPIPHEERGNILEAYYRQLTHADLSVQNTAARAWCRWEGVASKLIPDANLVDAFTADDVARAMARIETHYFVNKSYFDEPDQLLEHIPLIRHIPAIIVQGRYDMITPMRTAWQLHQAWPEAQWALVPDAGHSALEPGMTDALVRATDAFVQI